MIIDQTIDRKINQILTKEYQDRKEAHIPSGKLSASGLGKPTQFQVLKTIGVPPKDIDQYVLRKFQRGDHVEEWLVSNTPSVVETQKPIEYRGVVGFADTIIDTSEYECKMGIIPNEIKSVTNANFKWLNIKKEPNLGHALQGACYALAEGTKHFGITYVASDDYRILMLIEETAKYKNMIDEIIDQYDFWMKNKSVPVFEAREEWQKKPEYQDYPQFACLQTPQEVMEELAKYEVKW
jgi:hypothetical protein